MHTFGRLISVIVALLVSASSLFALEELVALPTQLDEGKRREARQQYLDKLIDSMKESCDLTERELRRLQVASKGAVEYSFESERDDKTRRRTRELEWGLVVQLNEPNAHDVSAAARHPIWTTTLDRLLQGERLRVAKSLAQKQLAELQQRDPRVRRFIRGFDMNGKLKMGAPVRVLKVRRAVDAGLVLPGQDK